jgi:hypothetical protein
MLMLSLFGAAERTAEEYGTLLAEAGFDLVGTQPTSSGLVVLTAVRSDP